MGRDENKPELRGMSQEHMATTCHWSNLGAISSVCPQIIIVRELYLQKTLPVQAMLSLPLGRAIQDCSHSHQDNVAGTDHLRSRSKHTARLTGCEADSPFESLFNSKTVSSSINQRKAHIQPTSDGHPEKENESCFYIVKTMVVYSVW